MSEISYRYSIKDLYDKIDYRPEILKVKFTGEYRGVSHIKYYNGRVLVIVARLIYGRDVHIKAVFSHEKIALKLKESIDKIKGMASETSIELVSRIPWGYA